MTVHRILAAIVIASVLSACSGGGANVAPATAESPAAVQTLAPIGVSCSGESLQSSVSESALYATINAQHPSETDATLQNAGHTLLADVNTYTAAMPQTASLSSQGGFIPGGLVSRVYPYALSNNGNLGVAQSYVTYAFEYQSYATAAKYPIATTDPNGGATIYQWGPGGFETSSASSGPFEAQFAAATTTAVFLADLGHGLLLMEEGGGTLSPTDPSSPYQGVYRGKTYLQHAEDALHWLLQPTQITALSGDVTNTNRVLRYADAYLLMGKAAANAGDLADGCASIAESGVFMAKALTSQCTSGNDEIFWEPNGDSVIGCPTTQPIFDSSYQGVSLMYLLWYFANMPTGGVVYPSGTISPSAVLTAIQQGFNQEISQTQFVSGGTTHTPSSGWCYSTGSGFADGEISECSSSRIQGLGCTATPYGDASNGEPFDAISVSNAFQEYGFLPNGIGSPATVNIADQVARYYSGYNAAHECGSDPNQPFYL